MTLDTYNHVFTSIGEYPENIELINNSMWRNKNKLFNTLKELQKSATGIKRFDFICDEDILDDINTSRMNKSERELTFLVNTNVISIEKRENFRQSKFYNTKIYNSDIILNNDLFDKFLLVFINGELYTNFYITPEEDITKVTFNISSSTSQSEIRNFLLHSEVKKLFESKSKVTVIILPAFNISERVFENEGVLKDLSVGDGIDISDFSSLTDIYSGDNFICMITSEPGKFFKYKTIYTKIVENRIQFTDGQFTNYPVGKYYMRLYHIPNYNEKKEISNNKFFGFKIKDNPIPTENVLLFTINDDKKQVYFDHDSTLTLFYPNIYEITKTHNLNNIAISLYKEQKYADTSYLNELKLYHRFAFLELFNETDEDKKTDILASMYEDGSIDRFIKDYDEIHEDYNIEDFSGSGKEHYQYKIDKFRSLINKHGDFYSTYLDKVIDYNLRYPIEIPENLDQYKRSNNFNEFPSDTSKHTTFDEECYLFVSNVCPYETLIYIGNEYFPPKYDFYDENFRYLYIPTRLVNKDTVIMKEPLPNNTFEKTFTVSSVNEYFKFDIVGERKIPASELFVTYNDGVNEKYLPKTDYTFYKEIDSVMVPIDSDDFYYYPTYYLKINNNNFVNIELKVRVANESFVFKIIGSSVFTFNADIINDPSRFLIFKNGQMLPRNVGSVIKFNFSENVNGPHQITINFKNNVTDTFTIIYTSTRYTTYGKYYKPTINTTGLVDLFGIIDKPLDFKWFDIYLNGYRLDENTSEFLGPYLLHVKNIKSSQNLEIYEKYFKNLNNNYQTEDITNYIYKNIPGLMDGLNELLKDTLPAPDSPESIPNIIDEIIYDYLEFIDKYLAPVIDIINPDLNQFTEDFIIDYPDIADENNIFFINPNRDMTGIEMGTNIFFNPSIDSR